MVLEAEGYRVLTASSGQEALTSAKSTQLDAVVLDFNMPEMNGGEVAERLRGEFPHLKIIMLSGYPEDVSAETRTLMDGFVGKGGNPDELLLAIRTALDGEDQDCMESNPYVLFGSNPFIPKLLRLCVEATGADFGNVQLFDSSRQELTIVSHHGFGSEFLDHFRTVSSDSSACVRAMNRRSRVVVRDVASDPLFQDQRTRDVMHRARVQSCQSTPLITSSGKFIGVASTHSTRPRSFFPKVLKDVDALINPLLDEMASTVTIPRKMSCRPIGGDSRAAWGHPAAKNHRP